MTTRAEIKHKLEQTRIFVATVSSMQGKSELFHLIPFDVAIMDEASQLLEPAVVGLLTRFKKTILIGDHMQLPAVSMQPERMSRIKPVSYTHLDVYKRQLSAPRIYYAMGADKVFFPWLADIHPKFGTPVKAIVLQSGWAGILLVFWGTFESLATYVVFMDWIFMTLAAIALFKFRKRMHTSEKATYKVPFYPITPLIFIGISVWFLGSTLVGRPVQALAGLILMLIGLPFYFLFKRSKGDVYKRQREHRA